MSKKIMLAGIAVSVMALGAPEASAHHRFDCKFSSITPVMYGWIAGDPGEDVSLDCWLVVGTATPWGIHATGTTFAADAELGPFEAAEGEVVYVCYQATAGQHTVSGCDEAA